MSPVFSFEGSANFPYIYQGSNSAPVVGETNGLVRTGKPGIYQGIKLIKLK